MAFPPPELPLTNSVTRQAFQEVFDQLRHMRRDPDSFGLLGRREVLSLIDLFDRAGEQLQEKRHALKTLEDYEKHHLDQTKFVTVLRRGLERLPPGISIPYFNPEFFHCFFDDLVIRQTWSCD